MKMTTDERASVMLKVSECNECLQSCCITLKSKISKLDEEKRGIEISVNSFFLHLLRLWKLDKFATFNSV